MDLGGDEEARPDAGLGVDGDIHGGHSLHRFGIGWHLPLNRIRQPSVEGAILPSRHPVGSHHHLRQHSQLPQGSHLRPQENVSKKTKLSSNTNKNIHGWPQILNRAAKLWERVRINLDHGVSSVSAPLRKLGQLQVIAGQPLQNCVPQARGLMYG